LSSGDGVTPPDRRRRAGNLGGVRRSGGAAGGANSEPQGKHCAGCPPVGAAMQRRRAGGAVSGGVEGVQPERLRAAIAAKEQPCPLLARGKRLLRPSPPMRRSARRSHLTGRAGTAGQASAWLDRRCLGKGGSVSWPVSASMMGASGAKGTQKTSGRPWARVAASFLSDQTQTAE
jgi:hypothetical protein